LLEWTDAEGGKKVERLLHVDPHTDVAQVIRVDRADAQNRACQLAELEAAVLAGKAKILDTDPYAYLQEPEDMIPPKHRRRRDRAMEIIKSVITAPDGGVFNPAVRGPLIEAAAREFRVTKKRIYRYLRRWMQG